MARRRAGEDASRRDEAGRLLATPPARFTAERDALARALAERGDEAGAASVRKLRRPVGLAWVLNRLARERRDDVAALLAAGDRLRAGQRRALAGHGAAELRDAEQALRTAARGLRARAGEVLAEEGRPASPGALARIELLLRVAATAPGGARDALREGTFSREPEVAGGDLSGLGVVAGAASAERGGEGRALEAREKGAGRGGRGRTSREGEAAALRAEREARARAREEARAVRDRARELAAARKRVEQAERAAREARSAADAAARRAQAARERAEAAEAAAASRRAELEAQRRPE